MEEKGSGVIKSEYSYDNIVWNEIKNNKIILTEEQNSNIFIKATDLAGNVSEVVSTTVKIDKTLPSIENTENEELQASKSNGCPVYEGIDAMSQNK